MAAIPPRTSSSATTGSTGVEFVSSETIDDGRITRIWLDCAQTHNAQNRTMLVQLDEAFCRAEADRKSVV